MLIPRSSRLIGEYKAATPGGPEPRLSHVDPARPARRRVGRARLAGRRFHRARPASAGRSTATSSRASARRCCCRSSAARARSAPAALDGHRRRRPKRRVRGGPAGRQPRPDDQGPPGRADPRVHRARPRSSLAGAKRVSARSRRFRRGATGIDPFLEAYLQPFRHWLAQDTSPKSSSTGRAKCGSSSAGTNDAATRRRRSTTAWLQRLAEQVARVSHQGISREHPLLARDAAQRRPRAIRRLRPRRARTGRWRSAATACSTCRSRPMLRAARSRRRRKLPVSPEEDRSASSARR